MNSLLKLKNYFCANSTNAFEKYINSNSSAIVYKKGVGRKAHSSIVIPYLPATKEQTIEFFKDNKIENKTLLFNIDNSHLIGIRRLVAKQYMNKNIYKGHSEPLDILNKSNPDVPKNQIQYIFDSDIFAITDPLFAGQKDRDFDELFNQIIDYYAKNVSRGVERFFQQYKVTTQCLYLLETAYNLNNHIQFIGLNQYKLRRLITSYLSLAQVKYLFLQCCKYHQSKMPTKSALFHQNSRQTLWRIHYDFLQPINYYNFHQTLSKTPRSIGVGYEYDFQKPKQPLINTDGIKDKQPDAQKIQKNAILQVLLGKLWDQPYTNNPFPYLSTPFQHLNKQDQKTVIDIYNKHYTSYKLVSQKFKKNQQI